MMPTLTEEQIRDDLHLAQRVTAILATITGPDILPLHLLATTQGPVFPPVAHWQRDFASLHQRDLVQPVGADGYRLTPLGQEVLWRILLNGLIDAAQQNRL